MHFSLFTNERYRAIKAQHDRESSRELSASASWGEKADCTCSARQAEAAQAATWSGLHGTNRSRGRFLTTIHNTPTSDFERRPVSLFYLPPIPNTVTVVVDDDSHIQRIVLATRETTVTQPVSHRPMWYPSNEVIKSDTKRFLALGGLHQDKLCDILQAMAPTNVETVYQNFLFHIESNLDRLGMLSPSHGQRSQQQSRQIILQSVLMNKPKFLKTTHYTEIRKIEMQRSMVVEGGLGVMKPAREPASSRPKPCASLKKPHKPCPFAAPCRPS